MYKYKVEFIALNDSVGFEIKSEDEKFINSFFWDLTLLFSKIDKTKKKISVESLQKKTDETYTAIESFVEKYVGNFKKLNAVTTFLRKLNENEHFLYLPNLNLDIKEKIRLRNYLLALSEGTNFDNVQKQMDDLYGDFLDTYQLQAFGNERIRIGEEDRSKRVCRFCSNKRD